MFNACGLIVVVALSDTARDTYTPMSKAWLRSVREREERLSHEVLDRGWAIVKRQEGGFGASADAECASPTSNILVLRCFLQKQ